jgi:hypothetical protein
MFRNPTRTRPTGARPVTESQARAGLARALDEAGEIVASACGTCGANVRADDPEAEQTYAEIGRTWPYVRKVRSWRYHRVCFAARGRSGRPGDRGGPAMLLALALDPAARPVRATQAHYDVARRLGVPFEYHELEDSSSADNGRGRRPFHHVKRAEMEELREAVARRHQELTVPVPHPSGWPCAVCGRSHELVDAWGKLRDLPVCGTCAELVKRSEIPGNLPLWRSARDIVLAEASHLVPARATTWELPLAKDMPGYSKVSPAAPAAPPWAYVADLPEVPLTEEEALAQRMSELERRLAEATA